MGSASKNLNTKGALACPPSILGIVSDTVKRKLAAHLVGNARASKFLPVPPCLKLAVGSSGDSSWMPVTSRSSHLLRNQRRRRVGAVHRVQKLEVIALLYSCLDADPRQ